LGGVRVAGLARGTMAVDGNSALPAAAAVLMLPLAPSVDILLLLIA